MFEDETICQWEDDEVSGGISIVRLKCWGPAFGDGKIFTCHRFRDTGETPGVVPERWKKYLLGQAKNLYDQYYETHSRQDAPELLAYDLVDQED